MIAAFGLGLLGMFFWQASEAPDIAGNWTGEEWGAVVLEAKQPGQYEGSYTDSDNAKSGTVHLKWSRVESPTNSRPRPVFRIHPDGYVNVLAYSPDGKTLAVGGGTRSVAFSPDSKLVAIGAQRFDKDNDTSTGAVSLIHALSGIMEWQQTVPSGSIKLRLQDTRQDRRAKDGEV